MERTKRKIKINAHENTAKNKSKPQLPTLVLLSHENVDVCFRLDRIQPLDILDIIVPARADTILGNAKVIGVH